MEINASEEVYLQPRYDRLLDINVQEEIDHLSEAEMAEGKRLIGLCLLREYQSETLWYRAMFDVIVSGFYDDKPELQMANS